MGEERALVKTPRERRQAGRRGEWAQRGLEQERQAEQAGRIAAGASAGPARMEGHKQEAEEHRQEGQREARAAERDDDRRVQAAEREAVEPANRQTPGTWEQPARLLPAS